MSEFEKELAKAGGQVVTETARDARKALGQLFGDAVHELAAIMGDRVRLWRFKNLLDISDEVHRIAESRGLSSEQLKALPLGDALRVADAASYEDDPELQGLWARLIANAASSAEGAGVGRAFVDLLRSLSPEEAAFLDLLWAKRTHAGKSSEERDRVIEENIVRTSDIWKKYSVEIQQVAIQNLFRMRCVAVVPPRTSQSMLSMMDLTNRGSSVSARAVQNVVDELMRYISISVGGRPPVNGPVGGLHTQHLREGAYMLTPLGAALMKACALEG